MKEPRKYFSEGCASTVNFSGITYLKVACFALVPLLTLKAGAQIPIVNRPPDRGKLLSRDSVNLSFNMPGLFTQAIAGGLGESDVNTLHSYGNPATLAAENQGVISGTVGFTYAPLMPVLGLPDFYELGLDARVQIAGFGYRLSIKNHQFGIASGSEYSLSVATGISSWGDLQNHFGATLTLAKGPDDVEKSGLSNTGLLMDIGYFGQWGKHFQFGLSANRLGQNLNGYRHTVYLDRHEAGTSSYLASHDDANYLLTPPAFQIEMGSPLNFNSRKLHILNMTLSSAYSKQYTLSGWKGERIFFEADLNSILLNTFLLDQGYFQEWGGPKIFRLGFGLHLFRHLAFKVRILQSEDILTDGQRVFSVTLHNLLQWRADDGRWWRLRKEN